MPWALSLRRKQLILNLARNKYAGLTDSHLCEKLRMLRSNILVSRETVRRLLRGRREWLPPRSAKNLAGNIDPVRFAIAPAWV